MMIFNFSHNYDFSPEINLGGDELNVVSESKILGMIFSSDLKWNAHVSFMCRKARGRIWMLRRMLQLGLNYNKVLDFYYKEIRSVLEYGAVVFNSGLTIKLSQEIENIQSSVLGLLSRNLGLRLSYTEACIFFCTEQLYSRRFDLCKHFIQRNSHSGLFVKTIKSHNTRVGKQCYQEYKCNTKRFYNSPLVYLTRLANNISK